jgi:hypothetical protein
VRVTASASPLAVAEVEAVDSVLSAATDDVDAAEEELADEDVEAVEPHPARAAAVMAAVRTMDTTCFFILVSFSFRKNVFLCFDIS